jgi:hypothetical protein
MIATSGFIPAELIVVEPSTPQRKERNDSMNWRKHFLYCKGTAPVSRSAPRQKAARIRPVVSTAVLDGKLGFRVAAAHREV